MANDDIGTRLFIGLAFVAGGLLVVALAPHRTLDCVHPARAPADTCPAIEQAESSDGSTPDCVTPPDIQCRLQAKVLGLIQTADVRMDGIRRFDLLVEKGTGYRKPKGVKRSSNVTLHLRFVDSNGPVDLGWHARAFTTYERHDRLVAFARKPVSARIELIDSPRVPLVVGFVMVLLGALTVNSALAARR